MQHWGPQDGRKILRPVYHWILDMVSTLYVAVYLPIDCRMSKQLFCEQSVLTTYFSQQGGGLFTQMLGRPKCLVGDPSMRTRFTVFAY